MVGVRRRSRGLAVAFSTIRDDVKARLTENEDPRDLAGTKGLFRGSWRSILEERVGVAPAKRNRCRARRGLQIEPAEGVKVEAREE